MKPMKCNACSTRWPGTGTYCPNCGSPVLVRSRNFFGDMLWFGAILILLVWLVKSI